MLAAQSAPGAAPAVQLSGTGGSSGIGGGYPLAKHQTTAATHLSAPPSQHPSGHPSPTESDHGGSTSGGSSSAKTSRSADLPDTHSESSEISPTSPHSDSSSGPDPHPRTSDGLPMTESQEGGTLLRTQGEDAAQDLTLPKDQQPRHRSHNNDPRDNSFESDHLDLKCKHCGCLFGDETLLAMHIQETHANTIGEGGSGEGLSAYHHQYLQAALQGSAVSYGHSIFGLNPSSTAPAGSFLEGSSSSSGAPPSESDAIASLLSLQQNQGEPVQEARLEGSTPADKEGKLKIFNPEAYCDLCNKEFCNKYYLQTHKATKHGISFGTGLSLLPPPRSSSFSSLLQDQIQGYENSKASPIHSSSGLPTLQMAGLIANAGSNNTTSSSVGFSDSSAQMATVSAAASSYPDGLSSLGADYKCPYCGQNCPSQYHLQSHIITLHSSNAAVGDSAAAAMMNPQAAQAAALQAMYTAQLMGTFGASQSPSNPMGALGGAAPFNNPLLDRMKLMAGLMQQPPHPATTTSAAGLQSSIPTTSASPSASALAAFGLGAPPQEMNASFLQSLAAAGNPPDLQSYLTAAAAAGAMSGGGAPGFGGEIPDRNMMGGLGQMNVSSGQIEEGTAQYQPSQNNGQIMNKDAYCEICRKEFCNKYFLKTHKQKKHGIPVEDSPSSARKRSFTETTSLAHMTNSVIANLFQNANGNQRSGEPPAKMSMLSDDLMRNTSSSVIKINPQQETGAVSASPSAEMESPRELKIAEGNGVKEEPMSYEDRGANAVTPAYSDPNADQGQNQNSYPCGICHKNFHSSLMLLAHTYNDHPTSQGMSPGGLGLESLLSGAFSGQSSQVSNGATPKKDGPVDPEAFCELCQKEFCSKYFLKTHRQNIHGIQPDIPTNSVASTPPSGLNLVAMIQAAAQGNPMPGSPKRGPSIGSLSRKSSVDSPSFDMGSPSMSGIKTPGSGGGRPRFIGKNFCEICNKEVCNKYFLRTHMLKMHGIVIDENKTIIGNINTVDKEKQGTLKFRCTICSMEMNSRQLLRMHKLKAHNIGSSFDALTPDPVRLPTEQPQNFNGSFLDNSLGSAPPNVTVSNNASVPLMSNTVTKDPPAYPEETGEIFSNNRYFDHFTVPCPHCERRFKSSKWLDIHISRDHGANEQTSEYSKENSASMEGEKTKEDTAIQKCEFCPMEFTDFIALNLHYIGQHALEIHGRTRNLAENTALKSFNSGNQQDSEMVNMGRKTPTGPTDAEKPEDTPKSASKTSPPMVVRHVNGSKLYRCSYCHYYTKWLSNLSVHEKRHTGDTPREEKPFICEICLRAYRYAHSLERHKSVHRYNVINGSNPLAAKFSGSPQKSPMKGFGTPEKLGAEEIMEGGSHSANIATGAKRFRCTKCQKVFKSRELCRTHLFAVHRRQEMFPSPLKIDHTSFMLDKNDKSAATISQVVEELHSQKEQKRLASLSQEEQENLESSTVSAGSPLKGYGMINSRALEAEGGSKALERPYTKQVFEAEWLNDAEPSVSSLVDRMVLYLPVFSRLQEPVELSLKLTPLNIHNGEIKSL